MAVPSPTVQALYAHALKARGFADDPAQRAAVARLDDLRTRLIDGGRARGAGVRMARKLLGAGAEESVRGIYLWGGVGRGKTWLMDLFYQSLPFPERRRRHFHRFMYDVHAALRRSRSKQAPLENVAARIAADVRVLCFDELFVTDIADAMILGGVFRALIEREVTLVCTSNTPPRRLYEGGLQRQRFVPAIELLERHTEVFELAGKTDYRLRHLQHAGTYLVAGDPAAGRRLESLFAELADGPGGSSGTLEVNGRRIPFVRDSDNVVWFQFAALCDGPRSQNDYIEIARDYASVIVSDVPILDATRDDAARRFIALVDELYDRGVKLVVSAAAPPPALYRGERLRAAFERTASRLVEMQSAAYLASQHKS